MNTNRIVLLAGVLVLLVGIAWFVGVFDSDFSTVDVPEWSIDSESISEVTLSVSTDTIDAVRSNAGWQLRTPVVAAADSARIRRLLKEIEELQIEAVVSTNPERYQKFGVDSSATSVRIVGGDQDRKIFLGESGPDFRTIFVRLDSDPRVFSAVGRVGVDGNVDAWRDKTVVNLSPSEIGSVTVFGFDDSYRVSRDAGGWVISEDDRSVPADSGSVVRWLRRFAPLKGDGFRTQTDFDAATEAARITFESLGGSSVSLEIRETGDDFLIPSPATREILRVSSGRRASIVPAAETFRK